MIIPEITAGQSIAINSPAKVGNVTAKRDKNKVRASPTDSSAGIHRDIRRAYAREEKV